MDAIAQNVGAKRVGKSTGVPARVVAFHDRVVAFHDRVAHFRDMLQPNRLCDCAAKNRSILVIPKPSQKPTSNKRVLDSK